MALTLVLKPSVSFHIEVGGHPINIQDYSLHVNWLNCSSDHCALVLDRAESKIAYVRSIFDLLAINRKTESRSIVTQLGTFSYEEAIWKTY